MIRRQFQLIIGLLTVGFLCSEVYAVQMSSGGLAGLMVQPSSQYYHSVYGGYFGIASDRNEIILRVSFAERPIFEANGYVDQDSAIFGTIGTNLTKIDGHGLLAHVGHGTVSGFIREVEPPGERRGYLVKGIVTQLEYVLRFSHVEFTMSHLLFTGKGNEEQTDARVAWPYSFFFAGLGGYF